MELDGSMIQALTDPAAFREMCARLVSTHEGQKKAKRDYYRRNRERINEQRRAKYAERKATEP